MKDSLQGISLRAGDLNNQKVLAAKLFGIASKQYQQLFPIIQTTSDPVIKNLGNQFVDRDVFAWLIEKYSGFVSSFSIVCGDYITDVLKEDGVIIFEGAQGVLLDKDHGFQPYTTGTTVTFDNALELLDALIIRAKL